MSRRATVASLLDRYARALAPYAGILTVSTCGGGGTGECPPKPDSATVLVDAEVGGTVSLESTLDGTVDVPLTRGAPVAQGGWACEAHVSSVAERRPSDGAPIALPASAFVACAKSTYPSSRLLTFSLPMGELRDATAVGVRTVKTSISMSTSGPTATTCDAFADATLEIVSADPAGASAPPPAHVTSDFSRDLTVELRFAGDTASVSPDRPCVATLQGSMRLRVRLSASSFRETETRDCL